MDITDWKMKVLDQHVLKFSFVTSLDEVSEEFPFQQHFILPC